MLNAGHAVAGCAAWLWSIWAPTVFENYARSDAPQYIVGR